MTPSFSSSPTGPHGEDVSGVNSIRAFLMERVQPFNSAPFLFLSGMSNRDSRNIMRSSKCN
jgi:hypothetical protein